MSPNICDLVTAMDRASDSSGSSDEGSGDDKKSKKKKKHKKEKKHKKDGDVSEESAEDRTKRTRH